MMARHIKLENFPVEKMLKKLIRRLFHAINEFTRKTKTYVLHLNLNIGKQNWLLDSFLFIIDNEEIIQYYIFNNFYFM